MKYITLAEYYSKKLANLAYIGNARLVKIIRENKDSTFLVRVYDGNGVTDWTLNSTQLIEVR